MADDLWSRVKDFAYRNAPEWVQGRLDENAAVYRAEGRGKGPAAQPEVREGRSDEVLRRYSEAIKSGQTQAEPTITKPRELESYKQEEAYNRKHGADDARWEKTKQDMGFRSREDGPALWVEPPLNLKDYARQMFEQRPITDRGWVALDLDQAARARQSGDLGGARHFVGQARLDRTQYLSQDRGLSR